MHRFGIRCAAVLLLLLTVCGGVLAEDLTVPLVSVTENNRKGISSDGLIPWGDGFLSFDIVISSGVPGYQDGVTASISYYAKNGKTSEMVLGWDLVLNGAEDAPVRCELWYAFPDGQQANYTNRTPASFSGDIHACRIVPLLAEGLSSAQYPTVMGSTAESEQEALSSGLVSRGSTRVAFQYPAACEIVDEGSIGTCVYLTENDYVTLMIPKGKLTGTAAVHELIGDPGEIAELSDSMNVFAAHGDASHRMYGLDVVELGVDLPEGTGLVVCAYCPYGRTEVYELLLTVLGSVTDTAALEDWLNNVWIPTVTKQ